MSDLTTRHSDPTTVRPITDVLWEIYKGDFVEEASNALAEVIRAVRQTGKKGALSIKLEVSKSDADEIAIEVVPQLGTKAPAPTKPKAIFMADDRGSLTRDDPRQQRIAVDAPTQENDR